MFLETMAHNGGQVEQESQIPKTEFKKTVSDFIPFFEVVRNQQRIDAIQTSDASKLHVFLSRNNIQKHLFDDNF